MRKTLATWPRALLKLALGSTWGSILYQAIKADINGKWSSAVEQWDGMIEIEREPWREYAPFQATFNDQGFIFFAMSFVIGEIVAGFSSYGWAFPDDWTIDAANTAAWWMGEASNQLVAGFYDDLQIGFRQVGSWENFSHAVCWGGSCKRSANAAGQSLIFMFYGRKLTLGVLLNPGGGFMDIMIDGALNTQLYTGSSGTYTTGTRPIDTKKTALHVVSFVRDSGTINIDSLSFS
jgi:hypothetical protein